MAGANPAIQGAICASRHRTHSPSTLCQEPLPCPLGHLPGLATRITDRHPPAPLNAPAPQNPASRKGSPETPSAYTPSAA
jgi:hypothetical protein